MVRSWRTGGLRSRLVLLVLLTLMPVILASVLATIRQRSRVRDQFLTAARYTTSTIATELDHVLVDTHEVLGVVERLPVVRTESPDCQAILRGLLNVHPYLTSIGLLDMEGHPVCTAGSAESVGTGWLQQVTTSRDFFIADSLPVGGSRQRALVLVHPIVEENRLQGVLVATFTLEWVDRLLATPTTAEGAVANVIDRNGVILYRSENPERYVGTRVSADALQRIREWEALGVDTAGLDGVTRRYVASPWGSDAHDSLTLAIGYPTSVVLQPFDTVLRTQLVFLGIGVVIAMLGVNSAAQRLVLAPVHALVAATARVRAGDFSARVTPAGGTEIRSLSQSFNRTVETLQRSHDLEEQLRHAQRLQAVGQLAGGVAHEFNNMLAVIMGHTETLLEADPGRVELLAIHDAAERSRLITQQLLAFSRQQLLQPKRASLNELVRTSIDALGSTLGARLTVTLELSPDDPQVMVDRTQFDHVLLNLLLNARDAMPTGGNVTVTTGVTLVANESIPGLADGRYVELCVRDTGHGMDAVTLARAMEPFFTTKPLGHGSGLGLSTAYGIVRQSGGELTIGSVPGQGTTVRIYLPQVP